MCPAVIISPVCNTQLWIFRQFIPSIIQTGITVVSYIVALPTHVVKEHVNSFGASFLERVCQRAHLLVVVSSIIANALQVLHLLITACKTCGQPWLTVCMQGTDPGTRRYIRTYTVCADYVLQCLQNFSHNSTFGITSHVSTAPPSTIIRHRVSNVMHRTQI